VGAISPRRFAAKGERLAMKIIIAGGSGQVGTILARHFHRAGKSVVVLSRSLQKAPWRVVHWNGLTLGPWLDESMAATF
jgi:uncharacterized protein